MMLSEPILGFSLTVVIVRVSMTLESSGFLNVSKQSLSGPSNENTNDLSRKPSIEKVATLLDWPPRPMSTLTKLKRPVVFSVMVSVPLFDR